MSGARRNLLAVRTDQGYGGRPADDEKHSICAADERTRTNERASEAFPFGAPANDSFGRFVSVVSKLSFPGFACESAPRFNACDDSLICAENYIK